MKTTSKSLKAVNPLAANGVRHTRFEYLNPAARSVCLAGTFNDWHPAVTEMLNLGDGRWVKELALPPGRYEYRLVVDGLWLPDPNCPDTVTNPFNEPNSLLTVLPKK